MRHIDQAATGVALLIVLALVASLWLALDQARSTDAPLVTPDDAGPLEPQWPAPRAEAGDPPADLGTHGATTRATSGPSP